MKKTVFLIIAFAMLCRTAAFAHPFKDAQGHWSDAELEKAYTNNVISGDPDGDGSGGSDANIKGEFLANGVENNKLSHTKGAISMARSQHPDSASSQFFICLDDVSAALDGNYAVFGKVIAGMDIVEKFAEVELDWSASGEQSIPKTPIKIKAMIVK